MAIECTSEALVAASVCLDCLDNYIDSADIYLLCEWANAPIVPEVPTPILDTSGEWLIDTSGQPILQA